MNKNLDRFTALAVGFYAWMITVFYGGILLDVVYSRSLDHVLSASDTKVVFSEVSDFLLCIGALAILAAIGAIAASWRLRTSRNLLIVSLLVIIFVFIIPVFIQQLPRNVLNLDVGPWIRIMLSGLSSLLVFIGLYTHIRGK